MIILHTIGTIPTRAHTHTHRHVWTQTIQSYIEKHSDRDLGSEEQKQTPNGVEMC